MKGKGKTVKVPLKKKFLSFTKRKGIVINSPTIPAVPPPESEEGGSKCGDDVYNPLLAAAVGVE